MCTLRVDLCICYVAVCRCACTSSDAASLAAPDLAFIVAALSHAHAAIASPTCTVTTLFTIRRKSLRDQAHVCARSGPLDTSWAVLVECQYRMQVCVHKRRRGNTRRARCCFRCCCALARTCGYRIAHARCHNPNAQKHQCIFFGHYWSAADD